MVTQKSPVHTFTYESNTYNVFHVNTGEGLPKHEHPYSHATICHAGSCVVRKASKEKIINKDTGALNLKSNEWHEIEALEDNTIFVNIFASNNEKY